MPTKRLPSNPNLEHLKYQAKDLLKARKAADPQANQRIREFHPRLSGTSDDAIRESRFGLSDAQLTIAREYGFSSWARLKAHIEQPDRDNLDLPQHERIKDSRFRRAVDLLDAGDTPGLRAHLSRYPAIVRQRVTFEGGNYFRNPTLLEFIAENPTRHGTLPQNIVQIATTILDAGGKAEQSSIDSTLGLVSSSRVARECRVQVSLIDLLCDYGAEPNSGMLPALLYGEFEAAEALIAQGANVDLVTATATGRVDAALALIPQTDRERRFLALCLAAQYGRAEIVDMLLDAGENPNRYSPIGTHSHTTPLHQAALAGHDRVVRSLVERGARLDMRDILFGGTPLDWANYAKQSEIAEYLGKQSG